MFCFLSLSSCLFSSAQIFIKFHCDFAASLLYFNLNRTELGYFVCVCVCTSIDSTLKFFQSRAQHKQQHCRSFVEILFFLLFVHFYLCKLHIVDWTIWWIGGCSYIFYHFWYFPISRTTLCVFVSWFCDLNLMHRYGNYGII